MKLNCFLFFLHLTICFNFISQKENNIWYFGQNAGLDFNSEPPVAISGSLNSQEGNSSICDQAGNLLFYSDGNIVWDKNGAIMPNGTGLFGDLSSTQSSIIIPVHNSCTRFYIFTTEDHVGNGRFCYSIIDMCLNGGLGDVEVLNKNIIIQNNISEKLTIIRHQNGIDYWLVTHELNSNKFYVFLVNEFGVQLPVISSIGSNHSTFIGPVKSNHAGNKIVTSVTFANICEMFDFNNSSGLITNMVNLTSQYSLPTHIYGIEFSSNDRFLYLSSFWGTSRLNQLDLTNTSMVTLATASGNYNYGFLQMAPNNKIYMSRYNQNYLSVINNPDSLGLACDFQNTGINLLGSTLSMIGLHNMTPTNFFPALNNNLTLGNDTILCNNSSLDLHLVSTSDCITNLTWSNSLTSDTVNINSTGIYWVDIDNGCFSFRDSIVVDIGAPPIVNLIEDTVLCGSNPLELYTNINDAELLWSNGSTNDTITADSATLYWLQAINSCGASIDSINVTYLQSPAVDLGNDIILCENQSVTLNAFSAGSTYLWSDNSTSDDLSVSQSGTYWVEVSNSSCTISDTIVVDIQNNPTINLGNDTTLCDNNLINLTFSDLSLSYLWQDNSTLLSQTLTQSGLYWLEVSNGNCSSRDSINVTYLQSPAVDLGIDTILCENQNVTLNAFSAGSTYLWNDNSTSDDLNVSQSGTYWVEVTNPSCTVSDTIVVDIQNNPTINLGNDTTLCDNNLINLTFSDLSLSYLWQDNSTLLSQTLNQSGLYWLQVSNGNCSSRDSINVTYLQSPAVDLGIDTILCENQSITLNAFSAGSTYLWSDNSTSDDLNVSQSGTYWVEVTNSSCTVSDTIIVDIQNNPTINLGNDTTLCDNNLINLTFSDLNLSYLWQDNSTLLSQTLAQSGLYWLEVSNGNCSSRDSINVTYLQSPAVDLGIDTILCENQNVSLNAFSAGSTYLWSDNSTSDDLNVSQSGTYWVEVTNPSCTVSDTIIVDIQNNPTINLGNDTTLCDNNLINLTFSDLSLSYLWQDNSTLLSQTLTQSGLYWLEVSNGNCSSRDSINVTYLQSPAVDLGIDTILCENQSVTLNAFSAGSTYLWNDNSTSDDLNVSQSGTYWVEVTNPSCRVNDTITFSDYQAFNLNIDTNSCIGEILKLEADYPLCLFLWNDGSSKPFLEVTTEGLYSVDVTNSCGVDKLSFFVDFEDCNCFVYVPNTFTPDGNRFNNVFEIEYFCDFINFHLMIFNRWGEFIFESYNPKVGWDGSYGDKLVQDGTYVYKLEYSSKASNTLSSKVGHVNVIK